MFRLEITQKCELVATLRQQLWKRPTVKAFLAFKGKKARSEGAKENGQIECDGKKGQMNEQLHGLQDDECRTTDSCRN